MIPVYQEKFGDMGSCFTACIASILEKSVHDMPNFIEHGDEWGLKAWDYLKQFGLTFTTIHLKYGDGPPDRIPPGYHIMNGYAPRGYRHSVVGYQGVMIHDPHPNGKGLITIDSWHIIHPIDMVLREEFTIPFIAK